MQSHTGAPLTYADLVRVPDDGLRHEIIGGAHHVTPAPVTMHQRLAVRLTAALYDYFESHPIGEVFAAPFDIVLSEHDVVEPDVLVILGDQADIVTDEHVRGAPAIVIEVVSPATRRRDQGVKRRLYERTGVREYWLVDPAGNVVLVYRRGERGFDPAVIFGVGGEPVLDTALLPGFSLGLPALFARSRTRR